MENILLILVLLPVFGYGYYAAKRFGRFLHDVNTRLNRRTSSGKPNMFDCL